jgi:hypothetical protein
MTLTLEYAADVVKAMPCGIMQTDLFSHFVDHFDLTGKKIEFFAILCGFGLVRSVQIS